MALLSLVENGEGSLSLFVEHLAATGGTASPLHTGLGTLAPLPWSLVICLVPGLKALAALRNDTNIITIDIAVIAISTGWSHLQHRLDAVLPR